MFVCEKKISNHVQTLRYNDSRIPITQMSFIDHYSFIIILHLNIHSYNLYNKYDTSVYNKQKKKKRLQAYIAILIIHV